MDVDANVDQHYQSQMMQTELCIAGVLLPVEECEKKSENEGRWKKCQQQCSPAHFSQLSSPKVFQTEEVACWP